ncbi:MAG: hypothetical protein ACW981_21075 [Candidatus Hodarchaeales archaeon]|jgi:putative exporter of polyketide antibiotics
MGQLKGFLLSTIGIVLGIYVMVAMLPQPLAELADITNTNVTTGSGATTFGAVVSASVLTMFGIIALIIPIIFIIKFVNEIRGNK